MTTEEEEELTNTTTYLVLNDNDTIDTLVPIEMKRFWDAWEVENISALEGITLQTADTGMPTHFDDPVTQWYPLTEYTAENEQLERFTIADYQSTVPFTTTVLSRDEFLSRQMAIDLWPVKLAAEVPGDLLLGGLMMVHEREDSMTCGPIMPQGGIQAVETMLYTMDIINSRLQYYTLGAHILDDCDKDTYGLEMAVDFIKGKNYYHLNKKKNNNS